MGYTEKRKMQIKEMQIEAAIKHHYLISLPNRADTIKLIVILSDSNDATRVTLMIEM